MKLHGIKYSHFEFVIINWQEDDLPRFGLIKDILVINTRVMFCANKYTTLGINRHYHSFLIKRTFRNDVVWLSDLIDFCSYQGHCLSNNLYITFRYHIEKIL